MSIHETSITIIITLLGIAYPILYQVISHLDEKYSSTIVISQFEFEERNKWFKCTFIISLILISIWYVNCQPFGWIFTIFSEDKGIVWLVNNPALISLIISTL